MATTYNFDCGCQVTDFDIIQECKDRNTCRRSASLNDKEIVILQHAADGLQYKEMTDISEKVQVVKNMTRAIFIKLRVSSITHAVSTALRRGLID